MNMLASGHRICDVAKILGVNRSTVSNWQKRNGRVGTVEFNLNTIFESTKNREYYSYILGMYFGGGNVNQTPKTYVLRAYLHTKYKNAIKYTKNAFDVLFENRTRLVDRSQSSKTNRVEIMTSSKNLPIMFPQHGFGKKKDREIKLTDWQEEIIDAKMLVKGLIVSNGTIFRNEETNSINIKFYNRSSDIADIFEKYISKLNFKYNRFSTNGHHVVDIFDLYDEEFLNELVELKGITENTILLTNYTDKFKERIFQTIDTKEKAYWLGFIYSDGNIKCDGNRIGFCLSIKDVILLERFCDFVGGDRSKIVSYNKKEMVYYYVNSLDMKNDLMSHNVFPNKSNRKEFPIIEDRELFLAFFLGVYDGDGSEGRSSLSSGNKEFLEHCCERFNISKDKIRYSTNHYGSCYNLLIGSLNYIEVLKNYSHSLERKRITTSQYFPSDDSVEFSKELISLSTCEDCGSVIGKESKYCRKCSPLHRDKKFEISKEELEKLVLEKPMTEIGKMFGVSDNAIKKRCKKLGIQLKSMLGHWTKVKYNKL